MVDDRTVLTRCRHALDVPQRLTLIALLWPAGFRPDPASEPGISRIGDELSPIIWMIVIDSVWKKQLQHFRLSRLGFGVTDDVSVPCLRDQVK